jgi:hypothetical protein
MFQLLKVQLLQMTVFRKMFHDPTADSSNIVGRLVVVIDVNPIHWFWTQILMKVFGYEG